MIIAVISALAGLIWALVALQRSGFDLASLNPFSWYRRYQWKKTYGTKPIYNLVEPVDVAAVLLMGVVKCEGEISAEQKKLITDIFVQDLKLDADEAADLMLASSHMIRDEIYLVDKLDKILEKSAAKFSDAHVQHLLTLMGRAAALEGAPNREQEKLIEATEQYFARKSKKKSGW